MMNIWDQLVECICRPPRDKYTLDHITGGSAGYFVVGSMEGFREDVVLTSKRGLPIHVSHYIPTGVATRTGGGFPTVIYCHCNSGSRRDAEEAVWNLLPSGIAVVAFDFTGSGLSGGQWVTLGANEADDLEVVIRYLRENSAASTIAIWGRSMGAVTALLYSARDPTISGLIVDSPFARLTDLMAEIVQQQKLPIPRIAMRLAIGIMRRSVMKRAGFDINLVAPIDVVGKSKIPCVFGHAYEDKFISIEHSKKLMKAYGAEYKNLVKFEGDHNTVRPAFWYDSVTCFLQQNLHLDEILAGGNPLQREVFNMLGARHPLLESPRAQGQTNTPWKVGDIPTDEGAQRQLSHDLALLEGSQGGASNGESFSARMGSEVRMGSEYQDKGSSKGLLPGGEHSPDHHHAGGTATQDDWLLAMRSWSEEQQLEYAMQQSLLELGGGTRGNSSNRSSQEEAESRAPPAILLPNSGKSSLSAEPLVVSSELPTTIPLSRTSSVEVLVSGPMARGATGGEPSVSGTLELPLASQHGPLGSTDPFIVVPATLPTSTMDGEQLEVADPHKSPPQSVQRTSPLPTGPLAPIAPSVQGPPPSPAGFVMPLNLPGARATLPAFRAGNGTLVQAPPTPPSMIPTPAPAPNQRLFLSDSGAGSTDPASKRVVLRQTQTVSGPLEAGVQ